LSNKEEFQGMCGGQAIEVAALRGDPTKFNISEPLLQYRDCNFSFAGIKNSFRTCILMEEEKYG
jgi:N6-L-threonylcarbamoyladenine synthase